MGLVTGRLAARVRQGSVATPATHSRDLQQQSTKLTTATVMTDQVPAAESDDRFQQLLVTVSQTVVNEICLMNETAATIKDHSLSNTASQHHHRLTAMSSHDIICLLHNLFVHISHF